MANWRKLDSAKRKYEAAEASAEKVQKYEGIEPMEVVYVNDDDWALVQEYLRTGDQNSAAYEAFSKYVFKEVEA